MRIHPIAVIAPDFELYRMAVQIREELDFEYTVVHSNLDDAVAAAKRLVEQGARIFVSRGGTLDRLRGSFSDTPVVGIPITEYEITVTLAEARKLSPVAAVVGFTSPLLQLAEKISKILNLDLKTCIVSSNEEIEEQVCAAHAAGAGVVIGFKATYDCATRLGIPAVQLYSQHEVVKKALADAKSLLNAITREEEWQKRQAAVINSISSAIFITDSRGTVTDFNRPAEAIIRPLEDGADLRQVFSAEFEQVLSGRTIRNILRRIRGTEYNCSLHPVTMGEQVSGVVFILEEISRLREIEQTARRKAVETGLRARYRFEDIKTQTPSMRRIIDLCARYARNNSTVMIYGESGTGKELLTQSMHNASPRATMPFVAINCGALPENLLESELFGYVEGAFTGARRGGKAGAFEQAHRGTIFLDEVGEISPMAQSRLLRTLEERQIVRLGDSRVIPIDVRIICATHRDLGAMTMTGAFRPDLFYRLNVLELTVPPLRERVADIRLLLESFVAALAQQAGRAAPTISPEAIALIESYGWPGNVRELRNAAERIVVGLEHQHISLDDMLDVLRLKKEDVPLTAPQTVKEQEEALIRKKLEECGQSRTLAAKALGISKSTLWRRLKSMGLD